MSQLFVLSPIWLNMNRIFDPLSAAEANVKRMFGTALRYDTRCYFNVHSKADMSQLNLPHGNDN